MSTIKKRRSPVTDRVAKHRIERLKLGLKRRELLVHDDDWPQVLALATKFAQKRLLPNTTE